ncbi:tetratricopeptide repeat protein [Streptacidiphilus jiangxiensis]|uniref:tetratricopeptide repeat protein n=2 Tax=Streptacidiphilus jiangxiensis TaxID=235985 RepID=UPI0015A6C5DF|nr:tetratricopeptide repeat protein [Streptacidiphilus jiangxiensis]
MNGSTFHGPTAIQTGPGGVQNVQFVYRWKPAYRIEDFPAVSAPVPARALERQPSRLLRAGHRVVPFTGRAHDLDNLARWRDDPTERLAVRLIHGPGGQGKTRLAARFAELSRQAGWTVWQAVVNEADTDRVATGEAPEAAAGVVLVVDYAERWPTAELRQLLREPLLHHGQVPVRVLLLARPAGLWWDSLNTWIGDHLDAASEAHPLLSLATHAAARAELYEQARNSFADQLGLPDEQHSRIGPPADLDHDEDYAQILTIHIAALAAVDAALHNDPAPSDPARASAYLLKRERAHWSQLHRRAHEPLATTPQAMGRAVLIATFTRALARDPHGWSVLQRTGLADTKAAANTVLDDHLYCYPAIRPDTVLEPLYPDRLGEDFIGLTTPPDHSTAHPVSGAVTDDWAGKVVSRLLLSGRTSAGPSAPWTRDALTVLIETARRWPHVATGQLYPLLKEHPELALQAGGAALAALASLDHIDITVLEAIEPLLPEGRHTDLDLGIAAIASTLAGHRLAATQDLLTRARINDHLAVRAHYAGLRDAALTAAQDALNTWRHLARTNPAVYEPDLAAALNNLGVWLSEMGRRGEALEVAAEAVAIRRRLADPVTGDPEVFEPDLASSLNNLGVRLSGVGRRGEALEVTTEAVAVYRRLADPVTGNPAAHEPDLAGALNNLGADLSEAGRRGEALEVTTEAVAVYRRLADPATGNPAAHEPNLAAALNNFGARLSGVGRWAEALEVTAEAVAVYRRLADPFTGNPAAHEPDLAGSLSNLGIWLSEVGRQAEALEVTTEAVAVYRRLADPATGNPAAYEWHLAAALNNLGAGLSGMGRRGKALKATTEAVAIRRRLADPVTGDPATYEPDLAASLSNLGSRLSGVGRWGEALEASAEAVAVYRRLADPVTGNPAAHEPDLARSLNNLGTRLSGVGRSAEALEATTEAVAIRRRLADPVTGSPAAHEPDLASSLNNLGIWLSELGRRAEALEATTAAVALYRRLADPVTGNPAAHEPDLAGALNNLGADLSGVGRQAEALEATTAAVAVYRRLADPVTGNPAAHEPDLAAALSNLGARLAQVGRRAEALEATTAAVAVYRRLADPVTGNPAAHEPDLAAALSNLGARLAQVGRRAEALEATTAAVAVYRRLADPVTGNPAAHEPDLATSLTFMGMLSRAAGGDLAGVLHSTGEAIEIYRRHIAAAPVLHPPLHVALNLQAMVLVDLGRVDDAAAVQSWLDENPLPPSLGPQV